MKPFQRDSEIFVKISSGIVDYTGIVNTASSTVELIFAEDAIMYDSLSPMQLVQYAFHNEDGSLGPWMVSCLGRDSLTSYVAEKFKLWRGQMLTAFGGCAKAFLPEIRRGYALCNIYDHMVFSSPLDEQANFEVEHNGKMVSLPRPVAALRVWNPEQKVFETLSPVMAGSPSPSQTAEYWQSFLAELRDALNPKYGESFVDDCISMEPAAVTQKYGF